MRKWLQNPLFAAVFVGFLQASPAQDSDLYDTGTLRTLHLEFAQANWWDLLEANYDSGVDIPAQLTVDGVLYPDVGVHFKGNSSYALTGSSEKKSFSISMDAFVEDQDLLGYDSLNLNNCFMDPTFMRETLTSNAMYDYIAAPRANFVLLTINGDDWGVYSNCEQVDGRFIKREYGNKDGNRYKATEAITGSSSGDSALVWLGPDPLAYQTNYALKNPGNPSAWTDLVDLCDTLNHAPQASLADELSQHLCIDDALWLNATSSVFADPDSYIRAGEEYFLYHDTQHNQFRISQYDLNESFGASTFGGYAISQRIRASPFMSESNGRFPLMNRLLADPGLRQDYCAHIRTLLDEKFNAAHLGPLIIEYFQLIEAHVQADPRRLYSYSDFVDNLTRTVSAEWWMPAAGLQEIILGRHDYLAHHPEINLPAPIITDHSLSPATPTHTDPLHLVIETQSAGAPVSAVSVRWRIQGPFLQEPMYDDGNHGDGAAGDGVWGVTLPPQPAGSNVEFIFRAASDIASGGAVTFSPRNTVRQPHNIFIEGPAEIRINELVAKNTSGIEDEMGETEDWIELVNLTSTPQDVSGFTLSDDPTQSQTWAIPPGTVIPPAGHLLIWADNDPQDGPLHATFKLSSDGETLTLHDAHGNFLDGLTFGQQFEDVATGRLFDGHRPWMTYPAPSPLAPNDPACGFRTIGPAHATDAEWTLSGQGDDHLGGTAELFATGLAPGATVSLFVSAGFASSYEVLPGLPVLLDPALLLHTATTTANPQGEATFQGALGGPITAGTTLWFQGYALNSAGNPSVSQGVHLIVCP